MDSSTSFNAQVQGWRESPPELHPFSGQGLRVWQYPSQFSKYLAKVAMLDVGSYMELGVRHGGSFVATVEVLERVEQLDFAVAVDIIPCPAINEYATMNPRIEFACLNTQSAAFAALLARACTACAMNSQISTAAWDRTWALGSPLGRSGLRRPSM
jgi:hypothetical protein